MSSQASTDRLLGDVGINPDFEEYGTSMHTDQHPDTVFGGSERRRQVEKKLLRKLDYRLTFLLLIYIMNYVSFPSFFSDIADNLTGNLRWTGAIYRKACHLYFYTCLFTRNVWKYRATKRPRRGSSLDRPTIQHSCQHPPRRLCAHASALVRRSPAGQMLLGYL